MGEGEGSPDQASLFKMSFKPVMITSQNVCPFSGDQNARY